MTTTPTALQASASTFARGGRRGDRGRRLLAEGSVTVLVVDDNDVFRRGMVRAVERDAGMQLAGEADGGEAALAAIERLQPDLVLLDFQMPDLDGLAVLRRLRDAGARPSCRVVLVSSSLDDEVKRAAGDAGAAGCIGKDTPRTQICAEALRLARQ
jgi:DNA-binding NarL/FixJ family response regulator